MSKPGTFLAAALEVLRRRRKPLTTGEIVEDAVRLGILRTDGKTPERTMAARLYVEVARNRRTRLRRLAVAGPTRAARNSVRWTVTSE